MTARSRIATDAARESADKSAHLTEGQSARMDHGATRLENQAAEAGVTPGVVSQNGLFPVTGNKGVSGNKQGRAGIVMGGRAHLFEPPERDRADGPEDDRQAELHERWYGWGEDWDAA